MAARTASSRRQSSQVARWSLTAVTSARFELPEQQAGQLVVRVLAHRRLIPITCPIRRSPLNIRAFTVPSGSPKLARDLHLGPAAEVGQLQHLPLLGREPVEAAAHLPGPDQVVGILSPVGVGEVADQLDGHGDMMRPAEVVDGPLAGDGEHPGLQAAVRVVAVAAAPHLEEDTLHHVLGLVVGHQPAQVGQDARPQGLVHVLDRPRVPLGQPGPEDGHRLQLHAPSSRRSLPRGFLQPRPGSPRTRAAGADRTRATPKGAPMSPRSLPRRAGLVLALCAASLLALPVAAGAQARARTWSGSPTSPPTPPPSTSTSTTTGCCPGSSTRPSPSTCELPAGSYDLAVRPAGAAASSDPVIEATAKVKAGNAYTVAAVGALADIEGEIFGDDLSAPGSGKAKVRVIHAAPEVPAVDVAVKGGPTLFEGAEFPSATDYAEVDAGHLPAAGQGGQRRRRAAGGQPAGEGGHHLLGGGRRRGRQGRRAAADRRRHRHRPGAPRRRRHRRRRDRPRRHQSPA